MSIKNVTIGSEFPEKLTVVIEIPKGSHNKYEYSEKLHTVCLDRVLHSSVVYPTEYGFIPDTRAEDGDHLDVLVLTTNLLFPGCVLTVRPVGMADMEDEKGKDWKVLAVPDTDPRFDSVKTLADVNKHTLKEIQHFFETYKLLEHKEVIFHGWLELEETYKVIGRCHKMYVDESEK